MASGGIIIPAEEEPNEATLVFREQADGRKVARLPGGKVVLVEITELDRVQDGERWHVRLRHKDTFAIAEPLERVRELTNPVLPAALGEALARALPATRSAPAPPPAPPPAPRAVVASPVERAPAPSPSEPPPPAGRVLPAPPAPVEPAPAVRPGPTLVEPWRPRPEPQPAAPVAAADPSQVIRPADRVSLFVDGANMDGACRSAGYFVDYRKAREFVVAGGAFVSGYYYLADFADPVQQRYMDFLAHAGYIVRRRPVKAIRDQETGERIIKGNLDTEIVLDMVSTVDNYDVAFLLSGDSDFERAIDLLRSRGRRVYLLTARAALSRELMYVADKPIFFIEDFKPVLIRDQRGLPRGLT